MPEEYGGVSRNLDLGFRYEYVFSPGGDEGYDQDVSAHTFAAGPKVSLIRSHVALFLPVGFAVGGSVGSELIWEFQPTAIFTVPISGSVDLNASAEGLIPLNRDRDTLCAVDLGLGFRPGRGLEFQAGNRNPFQPKRRRELLSGEPWPVLPARQIRRRPPALAVSSACPWRRRTGRPG